VAVIARIRDDRKYAKANARKMRITLRLGRDVGV
jgi:hypothetical protein